MKLLSSKFYNIPIPSKTKKISRNLTMRFDKQDDAIRYHLKSNEDTFVFAFEHEIPGKRKYIVDTIDRFYSNYIQLSTRHYYELILPFSPCHLYLDLEFNSQDNLDLDGTMMTRNLINSLVEYIDVELDRQTRDIVILESHTHIKFSLHLIIHLHNAMFKSYLSCKYLIESFLKTTGSEFLVMNGDKKQSFCDTSVYSRNRNFRLYLSSKLGKTTILQLPHEPEPTLELFKSTLVTFCQINTEMEYLDIKQEAHATNIKPISKTSLSITDESCQSLLTYMATQIKGIVNKVLKKDNTFILCIVGDRYCERINRQHKSNGIYYVVDRQQGVWYQMCHDVDCKGFVGVYHDLPPDIYYEIMEVSNEYIEHRLK